MKPGPKRSPHSGAAKSCKVRGCDRIVGYNGSHGMCSGHVGRMRKGIELTLPWKWRSERCKQPCEATGCLRPVTTMGCCTFHYARRKKGIPDSHPWKHRRIRKTRQNAPGGYMYVIVDGKKIMEHRQVMAKKLKRELFDHETVHHRNGIRDDNVPKNLELWSHSQPYGQRVPDKIRWAKEFLKQYGYKVQRG